MISRISLLCVVSPILLAAAIDAPATEAPKFEVPAIRFALVGDAIIERRLSVYTEPAFLDMTARIRSADVAFANFEMLVHDFEFSPAPVSGGTYLGASPFVLDELKWSGFRMISTANNHAMDYGVEGLRNNLRSRRRSRPHCRRHGENPRARAPSYLDNASGRVALIACSSTFSDLCPAGEQRPDLPGRPGLNPLHFQTIYTVAT